MRRLALLLIVLSIAGGGVFWTLSRPASLSDDWASVPEGDEDAGRLLFAAAGCASCHTPPKAADETLVLSGGRAFPSEFGTFFASNISTDPEVGIGAWSFEQFALALTEGVSPEGRHYYPAFPYTSYAKMSPGDVADLFAYIQTLPADATSSTPHDINFPFTLRRGIGLWKALYMTPDYHLSDTTTPQMERGRYLVEALAHCAECHTPRTMLGGLDKKRWMRGAPDPAGEGRIPGITPAQLDWSEADLLAYFTTGLTPDYDSAGGDMVDVIENLGQLSDADRAAIAAYVLSIPDAD